MRNEAVDIADDHAEDIQQMAQQWKEKARAAGTAAWDATKATVQQLQDKTREYSRATDRVIREKPYAAVGVAFGVGLLIGLLVTRGKSSEEEDGE